MKYCSKYYNVCNEISLKKILIKISRKNYFKPVKKNYVVFYYLLLCNNFNLAITYLCCFSIIANLLFCRSMISSKLACQLKYFLHNDAKSKLFKQCCVNK